MLARDCNCPARREVRILTIDLFVRLSADRMDDGEFELAQKLSNDLKRCPIDSMSVRWTN
jgi:hypothetical protein